MKICVLMGSPNKNGSTNILTENFIKGAQEVGHQVKKINILDFKINPCTGCLHCGYEGPCSQNDDNDFLKNEILNSDMIVFATPLYYYGMTAQLKTIIDRFCSYNSSLNRKRLKSALLTVAWNADDWTFNSLVEHYKTLVRYINLNDQGMILGYGCGTPFMTKRSKYPRLAYELGKSL